MTVTKRFLLLLGAICCCAAVAMAQVDSPNVFQLEGDATKTGTICFLTFANGGPAIATPGAPNTGGLNAQGCPTVSNVGSSSKPVTATWNLITWGANSDDWNVLYPNHKSNALFAPAFVADAVNSSSDNTFLGASSKDTQDISVWGWNPHGVQDKDDIENAGAAAYKLPNGDTAIVAFMDRYGNSGDSTAGFWFVQDSTFALCTGNGTDSNGPNAACKATNTFVGNHFDGDLLIVSDFSQGGAVSTINIFKWSGTGTGGSLTGPVATLSPAPCNPAAPGANFCGAVNNAFTQLATNKGTFYLSPVAVATGGWSYSCKNCGGSTSFQTGDFLEIGVDLNKIFTTGQIPCFSTFFAETRSSTSSTASLSDLTSPVSFPFCAMNGSGACSTGAIVGGGTKIEEDFSLTATNTGPAPLYDLTVKTISLPTGSLVAAASCDANAPAGYTYFATPNALTGTNTTPGDGCLALAIPDTSGGIPANTGTATILGKFDTSAALSSPALVSATLTASSSSTGSPQNVEASASADVGSSSCQPTVTSGLSLAKKCDTCLQSSGSTLVVKVNEGVQYCNSGDTSVNTILIQDCRGTESSAGAGGCTAGTSADTTGKYCCTVPWVTLGSGLTLDAAPSGGGSTCKVLLKDCTGVQNCTTCDNCTNTPSSLTSGAGVCDGTATSTCNLADTVTMDGNGLLVGAESATPKTASCPLCPINTTCAPISF